MEEGVFQRSHLLSLRNHKNNLKVRHSSVESTNRMAKGKELNGKVL